MTGIDSVVLAGALFTVWLVLAVLSHYLEEKVILSHKDWEGLPKYVFGKLKSWGKLDEKRS